MTVIVFGIVLDISNSAVKIIGLTIHKYAGFIVLNDLAVLVDFPDPITVILSVISFQPFKRCVPAVFITQLFGLRCGPCIRFAILILQLHLNAVRPVVILAAEYLFDGKLLLFAGRLRGNNRCSGVTSWIS